MHKIEHRKQICLQNPIIACSTDLVGNIPPRKLNLNFKNKDDIEKSVYLPRSIYSSRPTQSYHFQADLNWCDGTFKVGAITTGCIPIYNLSYGLQLGAAYI